MFSHAGFAASHLITRSFTGSLVLPGVAGRQHIPCEVPAPQGGPAGRGLPHAFTSQHLQRPGMGSTVVPVPGFGNSIISFCMCHENRIPLAVLCSISRCERVVEEEGWQCCNHFAGAVGTVVLADTVSVQPCTGHLHFWCVSF